MSTPQSKIYPINDIFFVSLEKVAKVPFHEIDSELVGEKAFGLAAVPELWTLPFFVISSSIFSELYGFRGASDDTRKKWLGNISIAMSSVGIQPDDSIVVRSSSSDESIINRGHFHSEFGYAATCDKALLNCINENLAHLEGGQIGIPLIIQKSVVTSDIGHLSNEHRCSKEPRDWLGERELRRKAVNFSINLRNWRNRINVHKAALDPLACNLSVNVPKVLELAAAWASQFKSRSHIEWVWDGSCVFIVQVEHEVISGDYDPSEYQILAQGEQASKLSFLPEINSAHAAFNKVKNVFTYRDLGLSTARVYLLSGSNNIRRLARGDFDRALLDDLAVLCASSLVIRTDLSMGDQSQRQMLPRTHEVRNLEDAKAWLSNNSEKAVSHGIQDDFAFIFHNFIPAKASAFAFAAPGERKVQVEALWGIPEGLYYNPHDKYVVDTLYSSLAKSSDVFGQYRVSESIYFKKYCVIPSSSGRWEVRMIKENLGWRRTIPKDSSFLQYIAKVTREISEREGCGVSVMWFVDVPDYVSKVPCIPWFHEEFDKKIHHYTGYSIKKTPFDEVYTVESLPDITELEELDDSERQIRQIRIRPKDEMLLRDKNTLQKVGLIAKRKGAIILMEGATLSHAYYQLQKTGALVSVSNAFSEDDEVTEFNKLVRDKIPDKIYQGGEFVTVASLKGERLLQALREKLVEEAIEVLDAGDYQSIIEEVADLQEVIGGLIQHLGADQDEIDQIKAMKKHKAGAFNDGVVLLETSNPLPKSHQPDIDSFGFPFGESERFDRVQSAPASMALHRAAKKWTDTRFHGAVSENLLNISVPLILDSWKAESSTLVNERKGTGALKAEVKGGRNGSDLTISISIFSMPSQLDMFEDS